MCKLLKRLYGVVPYKWKAVIAGMTGLFFSVVFMAFSFTFNDVYVTYPLQTVFREIAVMQAGSFACGAAMLPFYGKHLDAKRVHEAA